MLRAVVSTCRCACSTAATPRVTAAQPHLWTGTNPVLPAALPPLLQLDVRSVKTHAGAKKRFKLTKTGKIKAFKNGKSHLAQTKNRKRMRRLGKTLYVEGPQGQTLRKMLGK